MKSDNERRQNDSLNESMAFNPYVKPAKSSRSGPIFTVHPYPTKINYRAIVPFILAHTKPGDVVYDSFAGTCNTGFAAAACFKPDRSLLADLGPTDYSKVMWGARNAVCVDLGVLPTFIGRTLLKEIDIDAFIQEFNKTMSSVEGNWGWMYETVDDGGNPGILRYSFLSDFIVCSRCGSETKFIDLFVDLDRGVFLDSAVCESCGAPISAKDATRAHEVIYDDLVGEDRSVTKRRLFRVFGKTHRRNWTRDPIDQDREVLRRIDGVLLSGMSSAIPILTGVPRWGEMYRSGYHSGITHLHHFYTRRNFLALSALYEATSLMSPEFRDHFLLLVSSYNASHSSLMTRFVFKKNSSVPVVTSGQPGALYVSGCPVEKNVFLGVRKKLRELSAAVAEIKTWRPRVFVFTRAAQNSGLEAGSVDYIFTDPPFAGNIQYSELNFLSEAWLGSYTDNRYETIVSRYQGKDLTAYEKLLSDAFRENCRILKPGRYMTVVFHTRSDEIWRIVQRSIINSGFEIVDSSILDKRQASFKQTLTVGAVKKDPIIVARKPTGLVDSSPPEKPSSIEFFLRRRLSILERDDVIERSSDYLFSRYIGACLASGLEVNVSADEFKRRLERIAELREGVWHLRDSEK